MTQPYAHCPFCLQQFDLVCDTKIESFGDIMEMIEIHCPEHGNIIIMSKDIYSKASKGQFLADCPKCHETVFLDELSSLTGNG